MKILLLSDTHSTFDQTIEKHILWADEVWHAGDIGDLQVTDSIKKLKPLRAVYGNIDDHQARLEFPLNNIFTIQNQKVVITHIAGYPTKFSAKALELIKEHKPNIFICGHSHILKVQFDKQNNLLFLNPGAAGIHGFHKVRTMLRFEIIDSKITNLNIVEWPR